jgi:cyclophilin family peptidyl-prolyl cis-trans isomerase/protein-disulfide isomerase
MRKSGILLLLITALVLSSCAPQPTAVVPTSTPTVIPVTPTLTLTPLPSVTPTTTVTVQPTVAITPSGPATCKVIAAVPTPDATAQAILPPVSSSDWTTGSDSAAITITEYGDFQDASSAALNTVLQQLLKNYPNDVRLAFRHFPLSETYDKDTLAAQAAEAAGKQGKFWQYSNSLFTQQSEWTSLSTEDFTSWAYERAAELGLDAAQFKTDMLSDETVNFVKTSRANAVRLIQAGTLTTDPFLFMNGGAITPPYSLDSLTNLVKYFQLSDRVFTSCPEMTIDPGKQYTATIKTEKGDIVIDLYADKAPWAVNSFVFLAKQGWYDGSGFYRVIPGFMAQAGDPSNSGLGNPGYSFTSELTPDLRFDKPGVVGLANDGAGNNGSQFFITYAAVPSLDGQYTVFGQVTSGMEVLATLRPRNPGSDALLLTPDPILSVTIEVK